MAGAKISSYLEFVPTLRGTPKQNIWMYLDEAADVLYVNFQKPSVATDSELTEDDVIIRYAGEEVIGYTILHASQRGWSAPHSS